jgi:APA family basic amino acid/polyamine antiporter
MVAEDNTRATVRRLGLTTAAALVVANMVGTGVFTTTGLMVRDIQSAPAVLAAWLVGGVAALCGALTYAELTAALPRNGGEYQLLSRVYHPAVGFVVGWISLAVGFSAPTAASALAFGKYLTAIFPWVHPVGAAAALVIAATALHAVHLKAGSSTQNVFVIGVVLLIVALIVGGFVKGDPSLITAGSARPAGEALVSSDFAVGLIFVAYAYFGWNGATYVAGELKDPGRTLPRALVVGTLLVIVLYLGLNAVFLSSAPAKDLSGVVEIGHLAAVRLFGDRGGLLLSGLITVALVSSVSALMMAGPRVCQVMGEDYPKLKFLKERTRGGAPAAAVLLQSAIALVMVLTATFETVLTYAGVTISLSAALTVTGVFVLRMREPSLDRPYRTWGFPVTPPVFVILALWMSGHAVYRRPVIGLVALATVVAGAVLYLFVKPRGSAAS